MKDVSCVEPLDVVVQWFSCSTGTPSQLALFDVVLGSDDLMKYLRDSVISGLSNRIKVDPFLWQVLLGENAGAQEELIPNG